MVGVGATTVPIVGVGATGTGADMTVGVGAEAPGITTFTLITGLTVFVFVLDEFPPCAFAFPPEAFPPEASMALVLDRLFVLSLVLVLAVHLISV